MTKLIVTFRDLANAPKNRLTAIVAMWQTVVRNLETVARLA